VRCAQKITRRGRAGKGSGSKGCRGAEHDQYQEKHWCYGCQGSTSAVHVGRGDEGNRQAEMASPTKCRDYCYCQSQLPHFVRLDRGRHSGLPSGVAKAMHPSAWKESLSHGARALGDSKTTRLPETCQGHTISMWVLI
jgi:hypothetical protein